MGMTREEAIARLTAAGEPYEIVAGESWGRACRRFRHAPPTLRALFEGARSRETFLVYEGERYSFDETQRQAARIAQLLKTRFGVGKGDRVAISMRNYPEWTLAFNAATCLGAVAVAMNALWEPAEMQFGLQDCGAKALFADQERLDRLEPVRGELPSLAVIGVRPEKPLAKGVHSLEALLAEEGRETLPKVDLQPEDLATILYTSGSTGHPKGAVSSHLNVLSALMSWELETQITQLMTGAAMPELPYQLATLLGVPLFHATGSHAVMLMCYRAQRKMVCMRKWDVQEAMRLVEAERISSFVAPAAMTGDLVAASPASRHDLSSLLAVGGGGAPRAPEQVQQIARAFANALPNTGWGMTETNAIGTSIGGQDYVDHPGSSGRASAVMDLRVVDGQGRELPKGERGELQIKGVSVIQGYWKRPEANAETFDGDWLRTGDVAYIDEEGYVYIVDRLKDMVIRGGENIGCAEVEAGLLEHPQVLEASAYAVPDERLGEEVGASLHCRGPLDESQLRAFLAGRMAKFKIPRYLIFSSEPLPRIASGKIDKRRLRQEFASALAGGAG